MKTGLLEKVLVRRYGLPTKCTRRGLEALCWNPDDFDFASVLYVGMKWDAKLKKRYASLESIYQDALGGFLVKNLLRVAVLTPQKIYGLWHVDDLQMLPPVRRAAEMDPSIVFFMDSANVWFYGHKDGELYVFDSDGDDLASLGPIQQALETLIGEWGATG